MSKRFTAILVQDDDTSGCGIELPFDPRDMFGKVRAPVRVTLNQHTFRTTVCSMGGSYWIPVSKANRTAAGAEAGDKLKVAIEPDTEPRVVHPPPDLVAALAKHKAVRAAWEKLSYSHQREHVEAIEAAKKPETRQRRIEGTIRRLLEKR